MFEIRKTKKQFLKCKMCFCENDEVDENFTKSEKLK